MKRFVTSILFLFLLVTGLPLRAQVVDSTTVSYQGTDEIFANPERGFSAYRDIPIGAPLVRSLRENQAVSVIQRIYTVPQFNNSPFSEDFLDLVRSDLNAVREGGGKVVMRFSYTDDQNGADAPLDIILQQIEQLRPIFEENYDVIAYVEAGFIGAWGEWYYSSHHLNNTEDRRTVLYALLDALPADRMVAIRTPGYKKAIFGTTEPLSQDSAYNGSFRSRTGAHNDCFLASADDYGTYGDIQADKDYLHQDNKFVPQGGETCNPSIYSGCDNAQSDLVYMHWSVLNKDYHPAVLATWEDEGCLDDIKRNLGYRFVLLDATLPDSARPNGRFGLHFALYNQGFASPYNPRDLEVILRNLASGQAYFASSTDDPRFWFSHDTTYVSIEAGIPDTLPSGDYEVLLNLPDPMPNLHYRWEYSIRFANADTWDADTGYNSLLHTVTVDPDARGADYTGTTWFQAVQEWSEAPQPVTALPETSKITAISPNPFNPSTTIYFDLARPDHVRISIFNLLGERVATPLDRNLPTGEHAIIWNATGHSSGVYFVRMDSGPYHDFRKIILLQ